MKVVIAVQGVDTVPNRKTPNSPYTRAWGMEAAPATLRQIVGVFVPNGVTAIPGGKLEVTVREVSIYNGRVDLRGEVASGK